MAKATGFYCDNCKTFRTTDDTQAPLGWIRLTVRTPTHDPHGGFDLCSDDCVVKFARERVKAAKDAKADAKASAKAEEDGLARIPGSIDTWMRDNGPPVAASFWSQYGDGYQQTTGRGYSWVCALDETATSSLATFLDNSAKAIRSQGRTMTTEERRLVTAMDQTAENLRA